MGFFSWMYVGQDHKLFKKMLLLLYEKKKEEKKIKKKVKKLQDSSNTGRCVLLATSYSARQTLSGCTEINLGLCNIRND